MPKSPNIPQALDKDGLSMTKGYKAGSSVLQAIHPVTLTCKMCCSTACSTQEQDSGKETMDEATPTPRYRLLLARYSEILHRYCLHKKGFGPKDQIYPIIFQISLSKPIWLKKRTIPIYASLKTLKVSDNGSNFICNDTCHQKRKLLCKLKWTQKCGVFPHWKQLI